jgi:hypothetical protein
MGGLRRSPAVFLQAGLMAKEVSRDSTNPKAWRFLGKRLLFSSQMQTTIAYGTFQFLVMLRQRRVWAQLYLLTVSAQALHSTTRLAFLLVRTMVSCWWQINKILGCAELILTGLYRRLPGAEPREQAMGLGRSRRFQTCGPSQLPKKEP